ncbi:hypothetical protein [Megamonas hypermegale]|uniref:hypothetical protein n=1 Tax=Megamonas hypermegale TaxID=158847 RepID=UPI00242A3864|nr:hypothetical protein [Megamonas hypermegale]
MISIILGSIVLIVVSVHFIGALQTKRALMNKASEILDASLAKDDDIRLYYTANVNYYLAPYGKNYTTTTISIGTLITILNGLAMFYLDNIILGVICIIVLIWRLTSSINTFLALPNDKKANAKYLINRYKALSHLNIASMEEFLYFDQWSKDITYHYFSTHMTDFIKRDV